MSYANKEVRSFIKDLKGLVVELDDQTRKNHHKLNLTLMNRSGELVQLILILGKTPRSDWKVRTNATLKRLMKENDIPTIL